MVRGPREWLKKIALMNDVYLLNNPFTFQAMEKHSAYCAMMRLGLKVPDLADSTSRAAGQPTLRADGRAPQPAVRPRRDRRGIGYPLFMKPFDGGTWTAVTRRLQQRVALKLRGVRRAADALQAAVEGYDVFTRSPPSARRRGSCTST